MDLWEEIKQRLATTVSAEGFQNWVSKTRFLRSEGDTLWVSVPNEATREWMEQEYGTHVDNVIRALRPPMAKVVYDSGPTEAVSVAAAIAAPVSDGLAFNGIHLNPKLTFTNFVVGSCNQFAHAAAHAVA